MIFNVSQGGMAYISVTAPSGATITATCQGVTVTGSGTCTLSVPIIDTWTVTCSYNSVTKTDTVVVEEYGETYSVTFSYTATITVTTYPQSDVTASKTGQTDITGESDTNGVCVLTIPADGLGEWSVESDYGLWNRTKTVSVAEYGTDYPLDIPLPVPYFTFTTANNVVHNITKSTGTQTASSDFKYQRKNNGDWEFYALVNGTIKFHTPCHADIFLLGNGNAGGNGNYNVASQYLPPPNDYTLYWCNSVNGGAGGLGGYRKGYSDLDLTGTIPAVVATITSLGDYKANGTGYSQSAAAANGGYCFNDSTASGPDGNGYLVGAGGGKGGTSWHSGSTTSAQSGGVKGGGSGGSADASNSTANKGGNASYWGAGGGGGGAWGNSNQTTSSSGHGGSNTGGTGYQGFVAMRNAR